MYRQKQELLEEQEKHKKLLEEANRLSKAISIEQRRVQEIARIRSEKEAEIKRNQAKIENQNRESNKLKHDIEKAIEIVKRIDYAHSLGSSKYQEALRLIEGASSKQETREQKHDASKQICDVLNIKFDTNDSFEIDVLGALYEAKLM